MTAIGQAMPAAMPKLSRAAVCTLAALASTALSVPTLAAEFTATINLSTINSTTGVRLDGVAASDFSGVSVASAGDVNGDGFADLIVGASGADPNTLSAAGSSYVVFGKAAGFAGGNLDLSALNGGNGFRLDGVAASDFSGVSVASAGDVNGDGFADLIVGASGADPNAQSGAGSSYVVFGKATGFASAIALSTLNGGNGFRLDGVAADDRSGISVASAGDVNGDGFADLIVGASGADPNTLSAAGSSYVVFGRAAGFTSAINLSTLNGSNGFRLDGVAATDRSGFSAAGAGDVNGDGFADVMIGARYADPNTLSNAGSSYVVYGKASGFASAIALSTLDGGNGFRLDGVAAGDYSGFRVAGAGDVNGDGFADVMIGAYGADPNALSGAGSSYVVFGKGPGFASAVNLATLDGSNGFRLDGVAASDYSGRSAAGAGDVNGDGFADVMIGAFFADPNALSGAGSSYVMFGKGPASGGFASAINLSTLDGGNGFRLDGVAASDESGSSVASAGDINGDGFADLIIGAFVADPNLLSGAGSSYVLYGRAPDAAVTRVGSAASQYISGGAFKDTLWGSSGNDQLEGRSGVDSLDGGFGADTAVYAHASSGLVANLAAPGGNTGDAAGDKYNSVENLTGSKFADTLTGSGLANTFTGLAGADRLLGAGGADTLTGGPGKDAMTGGSGSDVFVFDKPSESLASTSRDTIADFNAGSSGTSVDRIDLRKIDAKTGVAGNQAFTFIGTSPFSNIKGQLRIALSGTTTIVSGDVNGDSVADFHIGLLNFTGLANLTAIDFLL